jgi:hypothetical protein
LRKFFTEADIEIQSSQTEVLLEEPPNKMEMKISRQQRLKSVAKAKEVKVVLLQIRQRYIDSDYLEPFCDLDFFPLPTRPYVPVVGGVQHLRGGFGWHRALPRRRTDLFGPFHLRRSLFVWRADAGDAPITGPYARASAVLYRVDDRYRSRRAHGDEHGDGAQVHHYSLAYAGDSFSSIAQLT